MPSGPMVVETLSNGHAGLGWLSEVRHHVVRHTTHDLRYLPR